MAVPGLYSHLLHGQLMSSRLPALGTMCLPGYLSAPYITLSLQLLQEYTFFAFSVTVVWLALNVLNGTIALFWFCVSGGSPPV